MLNVRMATSVPDLPGQGGWWAEKAATLTSGAGEGSVFLPGKSADTSNATRQALREAGEAFCAHLGITIKGDNFESSGVLDPSFWLIHPTTDRLFQAAALAFNRHHYTGKNAHGNGRLFDRAARGRNNNNNANINMNKNAKTNENAINRDSRSRATVGERKEEVKVETRDEETTAQGSRVAQKLEADDLVAEVELYNLKRIGSTLSLSSSSS